MVVVFPRLRVFPAMPPSAPQRGMEASTGAGAAGNEWRFPA
jgi:hypothetical protein